MPRRRNRFDKGGWGGVNAFSLWSGIKGEHLTSTPSSARQTSISQAVNHLVGLAITFHLKSSRSRDEVLQKSWTNDFKTALLLVPSKGLGGFIRALEL